ncbi:MAG: DNA repair protein RecO [Clostridiales bacterium]|nr:DNA repair protein RecO [Clostridiales bacterium]
MLATKDADAICIDAKRYRENDKMLTLFCDNGETVTAVCRGALKNTSKLKYASQLFSVCTYSLSPSKAGYYIVSGATPSALSFLSLSQDIEAFAYGCVCCEAVRLSAPTENREMYAALLSALGEFAAGENVKYDMVCARLLLTAFVSNGYAPLLGAVGTLCRAVEEAPAGKVSTVDLTIAERKLLFKSVVSRFTSVFGRLQSLPSALALQNDNA